MRLTQKALEMVKEPKLRIQLAIALNVTDQSIMKYIRNNMDILTKAAALKVIREETGLSDEEILEENEPVINI